VDRIVSTIEEGWRDAADVAWLTEADRQLLWKRSLLDPSVFYD
jgi:hypothetical protein